MASLQLRAVFAICLSFLFITVAFAQDIFPSNDTSRRGRRVQFTMNTNFDNMDVNVALQPLTNEAGLGGGLNQLEQITPSGPLYLTTDANLDALVPGSISFLSCERSDYLGTITAQRNLRLAAGKQPDAIVLYSRYASTCTYQPSNGFNYIWMYAMVDASSSQIIFNGLSSGNTQNPNADIRVNQSTTNSGNPSNGNVLGKSPTTAVAMIILYSITGIITALFLVIIVVGAIRAHRHPERYGPRHVVGRPRQSRAKGIARAMLETLPIVKFGDKEDDVKPPEGRRDIELGAANPEHRETAQSGTEQTNEAGTSSVPEATKQTGPDIVTTEAASGSAQSQEKTHQSMDPVDNGLACSVCTDDFVKGQDIRVLPCKHKFHPECIDPWLLNVSGTCPLCRIDLHPAPASTTVEEPDDGPSLETRVYSEQPSTTAEAASNEATRRNRRSRILSTLNIGRMRQATPQERLEALRTLRTEGMTGVQQPEQGSQNGSDRAINRFSRRFSRALGSRPPSGAPSSRPVSGVPPVAAEPQTSPVAETATPAGMETNSRPDQRRQGSFAG